MTPRAILRRLRRVEITTRRLVDDLFAGEYASVFKGRGIDFSEVRAYQYGDDIRTIDSNVTARMGEPFAKIYREERALTVMLVIDASASSDFGTHHRTKGELALEISALLAFSALKNNDRVGLILFTDRIEKFIPPNTGRRHVLRILRDLLTIEPQGRGTNIKQALEYLSHVTKQRAVVFLFSDFIADNFMRALSVTNRQHDLVAIRLIDEREKTFPPIGLMEFEDAESGAVRTINTSSNRFLKAFAEQAKETRERLLRDFRKAGVDFIETQTDASYVDALQRFFKRRERRFR